MKLLLDEMYSWRVAEQLRLRGHDVVAVKEREDLRKSADAFIFAVAQAEGRAVVTENVDHFQRLNLLSISEARVHCGLIYTTNHAFPRGNPRAVGNMVRALDVLLVSDLEIDGQEVWLKTV